MGRGVDAAVTVPTFGFIDAPQPPLIQEGELSISSLSVLMLLKKGAGDQFHHQPLYYVKAKKPKA